MKKLVLRFYFGEILDRLTRIKGAKGIKYIVMYIFFHLLLWCAKTNFCAINYNHYTSFAQKHNIT